MHFDAYEPIWFKLGIMIDTTELMIDTTEGHRDVKKLKYMGHLSHKILS